MTDTRGVLPHGGHAHVVTQRPGFHIGETEQGKKFENYKQESNTDSATT